MSSKPLLLIFVLLVSISMISIVSVESTSNITVNYNKIFSINHEHVNVNSDYELVVGWSIEPPRVNKKNNISIEINMFTSGNPSTVPVDNAENNLTGSVFKSSFSLRNQEILPTGDSGSYVIPFKPQQTGVYTLRVNGTLGSTVIDKNITLDTVSSVSLNLLYYFYIPIGLISIVGFSVILIQKKRKKD